MAKTTRNDGSSIGAVAAKTWTQAMIDNRDVAVPVTGTMSAVTTPQVGDPFSPEQVSATPRAVPGA